MRTDSGIKMRECVKALPLVAAFVLAGCGGSSSSTPPPTSASARFAPTKTLSGAYMYRGITPDGSVYMSQNGQGALVSGSSSTYPEGAIYRNGVIQKIETAPDLTGTTSYPIRPVAILDDGQRLMAQPNTSWDYHQLTPSL